MKMSQKQQVLGLVRSLGVLRPRDLGAHGIPRAVLSRLCEKGELMRCGRGLYVTGVEMMTENHSFAEIARRVPVGVVALLSALRLHGLGTQLPPEVWLAIPSKARRPRNTPVTLRIVRFSGKAFTEGVQERRIENVRVRIYNPAKTVADCFKFRNKVGLEVALEALRECWRKKKATADELWKYAKLCRVANVMRPYLESLV